MSAAARGILAALLMAAVSPASGQTFTNVAEASGAAVGLHGTAGAWGDFDGDGDLDLYVANRGAANALLANNGDDTFADVAAAAGVDEDGDSVAAAWADFDNDGDLDLYVADFFAQDFLYENSGGSFSEVGRARAMVDLTRRGSVTSAAWGDYDTDGYLDLYIGKFYHANELYHNDAGSLEPITGLGTGDQRDTGGLTWVDYDNDGDLDLYTVNREQENGLFRNDLDAGGDFAAIACAATVDNTEIGQAGAWGDFDNDGDLDLHLANVGANNLYRNDGEDRFSDVAAAAGVRSSGSGFLTAMSAWLDFDGDGHLDLFLANGAELELPDVLFANNGDGTFRDATAEAGLPTTGSSHLSVSRGDIDGDGAPDLYLTNGAALGNRLFRNAAGGSEFIKVHVRGKGPGAGGNNLFGLGAQVRLLDAVTDTLVSFTQMLPGPGAPEAIFGAPAGPYNVQVRFPGNEVPMIVGNVRGGDSITIEEP